MYFESAFYRVNHLSTMENEELKEFLKKAADKCNTAPESFYIYPTCITDEKVFDTIIILNDRRVLDKQTRNTIMSFNPKDGTVKIAKKSSEIIDYIKLGNVIIISTIQKFPMIYKELEEIKAKNPNRRFAVIADEAHQSQTGTAAGKVKIGLGADAESQIKAEDQDDTPEEGDASDEEQEKLIFDCFPVATCLKIFSCSSSEASPSSGVSS